MELLPLPFDAPLEAYAQQAEDLLAAHRSGDAQAVRLFHEKHPRFLDEKVVWLPKNIPESEIRAAELTIDDARLAIARWYDFRDWAAVVAFAAAVAVDGPVRRFEQAVEAVVDGDLKALREMLRADSELVRARSTRVTHFDPPVHGAMLLHYLAANGVEGHRQRSPKNAVEIAKALFDAGADANAVANLYGGECTTMSLLVSSTHPAEAGVQCALVETLVEHGASVEPLGSGNWMSPLMTALVFGYADAAETLVRLGARVETVAAAAGLGRLADVERLLPASTAELRHSGLALAASAGHADVVRLLLDAGEDPNRHNPPGHHAHSTPLHQAALAGHEPTVRILVERGARLDIKDTTFQSTPLGWAQYAGRDRVAAYLAERGG